MIEKSSMENIINITGKFVKPNGVLVNRIKSGLSIIDIDNSINVSS